MHKEIKRECAMSSCESMGKCLRLINPHLMDQKQRRIHPKDINHESRCYLIFIIFITINRLCADANFLCRKLAFNNAEPSTLQCLEDEQSAAMFISNMLSLDSKKINGVAYADDVAIPIPRPYLEIKVQQIQHNMSQINNSGLRYAMRTSPSNLEFCTSKNSHMKS